jgi:hypothetical protein
MWLIISQIFHVSKEGNFFDLVGKPTPPPVFTPDRHPLFNKEGVGGSSRKQNRPFYIM